MEAAERVRRCRDEEKKIAEIRDQIYELERQKRVLEEQKEKHYRTCRRIKQGKDGEKEKRKFIMACPNPDCRGYLSTAYKCEICTLHTCKDCLEIIGYSKDEPHVCNPDSVKSAELIRKDTRPCPTCGERIYKISGCDQMWCPHDGTAFSWKTGQIDTGHVHNPHFYQAQRAQNGGAAPRNPGDVLCGGLVQYSTLRRQVLNRTGGEGEEEALRKLLADLHQAVNHLTNHMLVEAREKVRDYGQTEGLRVGYLLGEKTQDEVATQVYRIDRLRAKWTEFLHLYELLSVVGIETFTNMVNLAALAHNNLYVAPDGRYTPEGLAAVADLVQQYHGVRRMCNDQFQRLSVTHSISVPQWDEAWTIRRQKFTAKALRLAEELAKPPEQKPQKKKRSANKKLRVAGAKADAE